MPFSEKVATEHPYTKDEAEDLEPNQNGVYGIYNKHELIYIGRGDIRERMLGHIGGDNLCINIHKPTGWVAVVTGQMTSLEKELIEEYDPVCNERVG